MAKQALEFFTVGGYPQVQGKDRIRLAKTDFIRADIQVLGPEGANELHTHSGNDGFWLVLSGRVKFYGEGVDPIADLGPMEGALVPHGTRYWFEAGSDEQLQILHVAARTNAKEDKTVKFTKPLRETADLVD